MNIHDKFEMRMMKQISHIIKYHQSLTQQGRVITLNEAAIEWITHHAANFPPLK